MATKGLATHVAPWLEIAGESENTMVAPQDGNTKEHNEILFQSPLGEAVLSHKTEKD
jgi:hypothetical protein